MGWPVDWLKQMISADEFDMWLRFFKRRPFDDQSNFQVPAAMLASTIVQVAGGRAKLSDFLVFGGKSNDAGDIERLLAENDW